MSAAKSDCRKFSPNVFNKSKCQNCFRTRDAHSAEALENNRASRNVFKCGYLFVAPDWDFNVSVNRTKRWQRRWFVLYDDGELTYALDEFPDTIPQGTIDMNTVLEVSDAEGVTGNEFAISITTPDKIYFVKGTSKEESKWWFDVLSRVAPRHLSRGKHKRNATFPSGRVSIPTAAVIAQDYCSEDDIRLNNYTRPKFLSSSELMRSEQDLISSLAAEEDEDVFPTNEETWDTESKHDVQVHNVLNTILSQEDQSEDQSHHQDIKPLNDSLSQLEELEARRRNRRYLKRENRLHRNQRSRIDGVSKMIPAKNRTEKSLNTEPPDLGGHVGSALAAAEKLEYLESINSAEEDPAPTTDRKRDSPLPVSRLSGKTNLRKSESLKHIPSESHERVREQVSGLRRYHSFKGSTTSPHRKLKPTFSASTPKRNKMTLENKSKVSPACEEFRSTPDLPKLSLDISKEHTIDGVFTRTGWLLRQTLSREWSRHWFVLRDSSLSYYRDPSAEHCGIMDGILDLNQVSGIREADSDRHCAFCLTMWDGKKHHLAAETDDFRHMWMQALQYASNLWSSASKEDFVRTEIVLPEHSFHQNRVCSPSSASFPCPSMSSSSSSSDDQSEYFSLVDEDEVSELSSSPRTLPPSPPVNRTVMSMVKHKSRIRSHCGLKTPTLQSTPLERVQGGRQDQQQRRLNRSLSQDALNSIRPDEIDIDNFSHHFRSNENLLMPTKLLREFTEGGINTKYSDAYAQKSRTKESSKDGLLRDFDPHFVEKYQCENHSKSSTPDTEEFECSSCKKVRSKLVAAKDQIRKLKKELADAHENFDKLEMFSYKLSQDLKAKEDDYSSQISLMTAKIDDLTSKYTLAEKNYRQLKQKAAKSEGKERKRSSLKNKEGLSLTKEYEHKLCDLEKKIQNIETVIQKESHRDGLSSNSCSFQECSTDSLESSEINVATDGSSGQGLFSRLQSLASRTQKVDEDLAASTSDERSKAPESPEIRLEVRDSEDQEVNDETSNHQWAISFDKNIKTLNKCLENYPENLSDCKNVFVGKIGKTLQWLQASLENICQSEYSNANLQNGKIMLLKNVSKVLTSYSEPFCELEATDLHLALLKISEFVKYLEKVRRFDDLSSFIKYDITKSAFQVITKTLCLALAEYDNREVSSIFYLMSEIPHINFFCPLFNKLYPLSDDANMSLSVSEKLQQLVDQRICVLNSILEAKKLRFESLWNTLADVPVQDNSTNHSQKISPIERYVSFMVTDIFRIAELHLPLSKLSNLYESGQETVKTWLQNLEKDLGDGLRTFLTELREQCPMIHESSVSLHDLNECTKKEITNFVSELSFLSVLYTVLNCLFSELSKNFQLSETLISDELLSSSIPKSRNVHSDFFNCRQCSTVCSLLSNSGSESLCWQEYVRQYRLYSSNHNGFLNCHLERVSGSGSDSSSSNCDKCVAAVALGKLKDVCNNVTCSECDAWIKKFCAAEQQRELERQEIDAKYAKELQLLEETLIKSSELHEKEMLQKENELKSTTLRLHNLKSEYEDQIQTLKSLHDHQLQSRPDDDDQASVRQTYRAEIDDLKDMFKKGLSVIENSHHRITDEMERKHQEEITVLRAEKDRALEMEAKATVTALEAIKKSHEQKLKEEKDVIREDLMKKLQNGELYESFFCKYGNDLEELKAEILNITEMYSAKCLETVALEEKVSDLQLQLEGAHNELCTLLTKNKEIDVSLCNI